MPCSGMICNVHGKGSIFSTIVIYVVVFCVQYSTSLIFGIRGGSAMQK